MAHQADDNDGDLPPNKDVDEMKKMPVGTDGGDGGPGQTQIHTDSGTGTVQEQQSTNLMEPHQTDETMPPVLMDDPLEDRLIQYLEQSGVWKREKLVMACWNLILAWCMLIMLVVNYEDQKKIFTHHTMTFYNWCILSSFISSLSSFIAVVSLMKFSANPNVFFKTVVIGLLRIGVSTLILSVITIASICSPMVTNVTSDMVSILMGIPGNMDLTFAVSNGTYEQMQGPYLVFIDRI
ncbi:hypothetical protein QJS10_CPA01g00656 [Acorus calamus]|uniref:Uncharacterized protein n=1 Tax=Acorus calamus TaxID=4465 RepID=A0AAV9FM66_ACOCL|nr:hypothetical protein QJS10_CPA01g00656 [Acorus calamus]